MKKKATIVSLPALLLLASATLFAFWKINDMKQQKELATVAEISNLQNLANS